MNEPSLWQRLKTSLQASAGEVVFGMEDGTVSIFGLVFGVAATTTDQKAVLIAGASGAVAAAVSMMAGTYLDAETGEDQTKVMASRITADLQKDPGAVLQGVTQRLQAVGMANDQAASVKSFLGSQPAVLRGFAMALAMPGDADSRQSPLVRSLWMLLADFLAAAIPILPFGFLPVSARPRGLGDRHHAVVDRARRRPRQDRRPRHRPHRVGDGIDRRRRGARRRRHRRVHIARLHVMRLTPTASCWRSRRLR